MRWRTEVTPTLTKGQWETKRGVECLLTSERKSGPLNITYHAFYGLKNLRLIEMELLRRIFLAEREEAIGHYVTSLRFELTYNRRDCVRISQFCVCPVIRVGKTADMPHYSAVQRFYILGRI
jgi:hypothetical protein